MDEFTDIAAIDRRLFVGKSLTYQPKLSDLENLLGNSVGLEDSINRSLRHLNRRVNQNTQAISRIFNELNTGIQTLAARIDTLVLGNPPPQFHQNRNANQNPNLNQNLNQNDPNNAQFENDPPFEEENDVHDFLNGLTFENQPNSNHVFVYTGETSSTFEAWSRKFLDHIEAFGRKLNEPEKLGRLKTLLDGTPRQILEELPPDRKDTLQNALDSLKTALDTPIRSQLAKQTLSVCRQKDNETIDTFVERLIPIFNAAYQELDQRTRKEMLKVAFLEKIKDDIAFHVRVGSSPTQTFEEIRVKAIEVENMLQSRKARQEPNQWIHTLATNNPSPNPPNFPKGNFSTWKNQPSPNIPRSVSFSTNPNYQPRNQQFQPRNQSFQPRNQPFYPNSNPRPAYRPNYNPRGNQNFPQRYRPILPYNPPNFSGNGNFSGLRDFGNNCRYCHKPGHSIWECRSRARNYGPFQNRAGPLPSQQRAFNSRYRSPPPQRQINSMEFEYDPTFDFQNMNLGGNQNINSLSLSNVPPHLPLDQNPPMESSLMPKVSSDTRNTNEQSPNVENPKSETTSEPKPSVENWESTHTPSYSIAPFLTRLNSVLLILLTLILSSSLASCSVPPHVPLVPMVCQTKLQGTVWTLPNSLPCPRLRPNFTDSVIPHNLKIYRPNVFQQKSKAWACRKIIKSFREYTNPVNDLIQQLLPPINIPISLSECKRMARDKKCKEGILSPENGLWRTQKSKPIDKRLPILGWAWRTHTTTDCFLFENEITVLHDESHHIQNPLGKSQHCKYTDASCVLSDNTTLIWRPSSEKLCKFTFLGKYTGYLLGNIWMASQNDIALSIPNNQTRINDCNRNLTLTDQNLAIGPLIQLTQGAQKDMRASRLHNSGIP